MPASRSEAETTRTARGPEGAGIKLSLLVVMSFEPDFNDASANSVAFQRPPENGRRGKPFAAEAAPTKAVTYSGRSGFSREFLRPAPELFSGSMEVLVLPKEA